MVSVTRSAATFPREVLEGVTSACCIMCAAFGGTYEVQFVAAVTDRLVLVDHNPDKLAAMGRYYPGSQLELADAFEWTAEAVARGDRFDLVTMDPWTRDTERVESELVPLALELAPVVLFGTFTGDGPIRNPRTMLRWRIARR